jgi:hypothetical protein
MCAEENYTNEKFMSAAPKNQKKKKSIKEHVQVGFNRLGSELFSY